MLADFDAEEHVWTADWQGQAHRSTILYIPPLWSRMEGSLATLIIAAEPFQCLHNLIHLSHLFRQLSCCQGTKQISLNCASQLIWQADMQLGT